MKVLFLTMVKINSLTDRGIYTDLLRKFSYGGHEVFAVCPIERREQKKTNLRKEDMGTLLSVQTMNLQKTSLIEKGFGTLAIEYQFLFAIKKYFFKVIRCFQTTGGNLLQLMFLKRNGAPLFNQLFYQGFSGYGKDAAAVYTSIPVSQWNP